MAPGQPRLSHSFDDLQLFDPNTPGLQLVWDSTSLSTLMGCPHRYWLKMVRGHLTTGTKTDLEFGVAFGDAMEVFYKAICARQPHDVALKRALRHALEKTWGPAGPRLGEYMQGWRCTGTEPYKPRGRKLVCPSAHKRAFMFGPAPEFCGTCGSPVVVETRWFPEVTGKDRLGLLRAIFAYCEGMKGGPLNIVSIGDTPLLEIGFAVPFPVDGVPFTLTGWFDSIKALDDDEVFICDYKTTKHTLGKGYFSQYSPNVQVDTYGLVGPMILNHGLPFSGVAIEAIQTLADGVRTGMSIFTQTFDKAAEWAQELGIWLKMATAFARSGTWPRNRTACHFCEFRDVCSAEPHSREQMLRENYVRARWNPLKRAVENVAPEKA